MISLKAHIEAGQWAADRFPPSVLREVCRRLGESDLALNVRLVEAGWSPLAVVESLQPGSASIIRGAVRSIAREIRKIGKTDGQGVAIRPNWDLVALSFWRAMDKFVTDSTKDASFLGRLWKKIRLLDSVDPMAEFTGAAAAGSVETPVGMQRPTNLLSMAKLKELFPDADESYLQGIFRTYGGRNSGSLTSSRAIASSSVRSLMGSRSSSPDLRVIR